jgi:hypothetical protein
VPDDEGQRQVDEADAGLVGQVEKSLCSLITDFDVS